MAVQWGDDVEAFRRRVRQELVAAMPDELDPTDLTGFTEASERRMLAWAAQRGYLALSLPTVYGGGGRGPIWQAAFNLEAAYTGAPLVDTAVTLVSQPILTFGSDEQRARFMPAICAGEQIWCIAYSEEDAGSDLAAITTTAEPTGGGFVVNGHKAHVTGAHKSDWCCTVARTRPDAPAREALSMFLVPMDAPGVSVRRRPTASGWTLSDITFDNVALGQEALLGTLHGGWSQLLSAVGTEGGGMFHVGFALRGLDQLRTSAEFGMLLTETAAAERLALRAIGRPAPPAASAMAKVYATELLQRIARVSGLESDYVEWVHPTIGGGTNEMKRTQIARALLADPAAVTAAVTAALASTPPGPAATLVSEARARGASTVSAGAGADADPDSTADTVNLSRLAAAAEMSGAAAAALELAVQRARERHQFGRPIGEFQAIAHRLADAAIDVTVVDTAVAAAARATDHDDPRGPLIVAQAKALANEACPRVTASAHQVWGAAGFYAEVPLHRWHRRVHQLARQHGTTDELHQLIAKL